MRPLVYLLMVLSSCAARSGVPSLLTPAALADGGVVATLVQLDARVFGSAFRCSLGAFAPALARNAPDVPTSGLTVAPTAASSPPSPCALAARQRT